MVCHCHEIKILSKGIEVLSFSGFGAQLLPIILGSVSRPAEVMAFGAVYVKGDPKKSARPLEPFLNEIKLFSCAGH
jgi:hypothetical protein